MQAQRDVHVFALREFVYDDETGTVDQGQVIELRGHRNDGKLLKVRYLAPCHPGDELVQCGACGKYFVDDAARESHGDRRHAFECECGWAPDPDAGDRAKLLATHRLHCDTAKAIKARERKSQREQIAAQPGRT